ERAEVASHAHLIGARWANGAAEHVVENLVPPAGRREGEIEREDLLDDGRMGWADVGQEQHDFDSGRALETDQLARNLEAAGGVAPSCRDALTPVSQGFAMGGFVPRGQQV